MKKIKIFTFSILGATLLTIGLYSCSSESELENIENNTDFNNYSQKLTNDPISQINELANELDLEANVDPNLSPDQGIQFSSFDEYSEFIKNFKDEHSEEIAIDLTPQPPTNTTFGCGDGIYSGSFGGYGGANLQFDLVISDGSISSVAGYLTGFTLGMTYTQGVVSIDAGGATVTGTINLVVFVEGIGTVWSIPVRHRLNLPC